MHDVEVRLPACYEGSRFSVKREKVLGTSFCKGEAINKKKEECKQSKNERGWLISYQADALARNASSAAMQPNTASLLLVALYVAPTMPTTAAKVQGSFRRAGAQCKL